ncbi:hypothetical protein BBP40_000830 [Aspergillus hancockii]|nr:hypothetical protein BBP40_000830 [Aspergillus hancockii]
MELTSILWRQSFCASLNKDGQNNLLDFKPKCNIWTILPPNPIIDPKTVNLVLAVACVVFGAASLLLDFDDKLISPVAALHPFVERYQGPNPKTSRYTLTAHNQNIIFSIPLAGSILGGLAASPPNFRFGRKRPVLLAYVSIGGGLLQVFEPSQAAFVAGRLINGIAMGIANGTAPLYLSEACK